MFSENAVFFLETYQAEIIARWAELCEQRLNPEFSASPQVAPEALEKLYRQLIDALQRRVYHNLNRTIETMIADEHTPSPLDVKELLALFAQAGLDEFELREDSLRNAKVIRDDLTSVGVTLRRVYAERLSPQLIGLLMRHKSDCCARWLEAIPTRRISDRFSILSHEDLQAFVDATFAIYEAILRGAESELVPDPDEPQRLISRYDAWIAAQINYFVPKGFRLVDVTAAVAHLYLLMEPILARAPWDGIGAYRASILLLQDARTTLIRGISDAYVERFSKDFYAEVGIMLHRIKNKLTSVPSTMQTILAVSDNDEYGAMFDPMVITVDEAAVWTRFDELMQTLIEVARPVAASDDPAALAALRAHFAEVEAYLGEHQNTLDLIRTMKLDSASVEMLHEMLGIVLEGGKQTEELTMELQVRMNELYEREPPRAEVLDIGELVSSAANEAAVDARAKDIDFRFENLADGVAIYGVRREIGRPFVQVIDNAIKYTPEKGAVRVSLAPDGDNQVVFQVKDSGIGIPPGEEELVFGLCERCSNAKDFARGTGTGLYYDRITVNHHNGEMWVESAGVGQGSTFFIRLPIHQEPLEYEGAGAAASGE